MVSGGGAIFVEDQLALLPGDRRIALAQLGEILASRFGVTREETAILGSHFRGFCSLISVTFWHEATFRFWSHF